MALPTTIDEVLQRLDEIIADAIQTQNPKGFFAALYRAVTAEVKKGIEMGRFEDGPRMEKLDVVFANRYIQAYDAYYHQQACSLAWKSAFDAVKADNIPAINHLFLGMNAHIILDLGVAAAEICPHNKIYTLENDFKEINLLLSAMVDGVEAKLSLISPIFFLIDLFGGKIDEKLAVFSMRIARKVAWENALKLAVVHDSHLWESTIHQIDRQANLLTQAFIPRGFTHYIAHFVRYWEMKNTAKAIEVLGRK
jgi:hypothetical protein